ncbi:MAG: hypothetical protein P0111_15375 [Nitrospira sp.]|nr:hypothetical protein [Nitrospira sp.]
MKSRIHPSLSLLFAVGLLSGCGGNDGASSPAVVSSEATAAPTDDQRAPQSDALTPAEVAQVNQAGTEPEPPKKPDM